MQVRGFNKKSATDDLKMKLDTLIQSQRSGAEPAAGMAHEFFVSELIKEDWSDMVATFYFPKLSKMIKDSRLRQFIDNTNRELLEQGQEASQIKNIAAKAHRFILSNIWILEDLI